MITLDSGDKIQGDASVAAVVDYSLYGLDNNSLKQLADGQLANSTGDLYTADSVDVVSTIVLVNTDSSARTVNLFMTPSGGTARRIIPEDLSLSAGYSLHWSGDKIAVMSTSGAIISSTSLEAHKDTHDPNDGSDALDTDVAAEISGVVAAGAGTSHSLSAADHIHAINHGITDNHIVTVDHADAASGEYARFTANGIESRSEAEVKADLNLEIGTDVLAQQTIGIANDNLVEMDDADAAENDYAKFTANGLEGRSYSEVMTDLAGQALNMQDALLTRPEIKDYSETPSALSTSSNVLTVNLENGNVFTYTPTENATTFTISNWLASKAQSFTIYLTQGATAYAIDWTDESIIWAGGTPPDITTVSTKYVIIISSPDGGTTKFGAFLEDVKAPA